MQHMYMRWPSLVFCSLVIVSQPDRRYQRIVVQIGVTLHSEQSARCKAKSFHHAP